MKNKKMIITFIIVIFNVIVVCLGVVIALQVKQNKKAEQEKQRLEDIAMNGTFYEKLDNGLKVNVLIVGDSIGEGAGGKDSSGSFPSRLAMAIGQAYGSYMSVTNVSMGGNASYSGYVRTMALDDGKDYDLAIICHGQNDEEKDFSLYYESIIRAIANKYPKCSIISVLESSQKEYTDKMKTIKGLCRHYDIPVADTIAAFRGNYEALVRPDGVHPNDEGYQLYSNTIEEVIYEQTSEERRLPNYNSIEPVNAEVKKFKNCRYYEKKEFKREDNTYSIELKEAGVLGLDYLYLGGDNVTQVLADGEVIATPTINFPHNFDQRHIDIVSQKCKVEKTLEIRFMSKEQADGFEGVAFSWE